MRRSRTLVAAILTGAFLVSTGAAAVAESGADRPVSFCGTAQRLAEEFSDLDARDISDEAVLEDVYKAIKRAAKEAPQSLKRAFRRLVRYYETLAGEDFDPTDRDVVEELATGAAKVGKAATKITNHLEKKCKLDAG